MAVKRSLAFGESWQAKLKDRFGVSKSEEINRPSGCETMLRALLYKCEHHEMAHALQVCPVLMSH